MSSNIIHFVQKYEKIFIFLNSPATCVSSYVSHDIITILKTVMVIQQIKTAERSCKKAKSN